jgi:hypothetical protein
VIINFAGFRKGEAVDVNVSYACCYKNTVRFSYSLVISGNLQFFIQVKRYGEDEAEEIHSDVKAYVVPQYAPYQNGYENASFTYDSPPPEYTNDFTQVTRF